jgi:hypothetical protein
MTPSIAAIVVLAAARPSRERAPRLLVLDGLSRAVEGAHPLVRSVMLSHIDVSRASPDSSHGLLSGRHEPQLPHRFPILGASSAEHAGGCRAAA